MANGGIVEVIGIVFSMIAIKLMMAVESTQVTIGAIGQRRPKKPQVIVALAIGAKKFLMLKIGIAFFGRISGLIFFFEEMYAEKTVQAAASTMMNTIVLSNKMIAGTATKYTKHAARAVKKGVTHPYYYRRNLRGHANRQGPH